MLYIGDSAASRAALRKAAERRVVRRVARGIYTSDFETDPETVVRRHFLALIGRLFPDSHLSHSTAALLSPMGALAFLSGGQAYRVSHALPGLKIVRFPDLPHPEIEWVEAPTPVSSGLTREPEIVRVAVSSTLQVVFECLSTARRYPEKGLTPDRMIELLRTLSADDRARAEAFATRNGLAAEYGRYVQLVALSIRSAAASLARSREFDLYFYGWRVGGLTALGSGECRFAYDPTWAVELSRELPIDRAPAYEGPRLPAFFDNLLPEGWTESRLRSVFKLDAADDVSLLATTEKYLSNLTVRQPGFDDALLAFDAHRWRLDEIAPDPSTVLPASQSWDLDPSTRRLWIQLRDRSGVRLSGVQPKLPVGIRPEGEGLSLVLGDLATPCTHLLKLASPLYDQLVENEWTSMELARRVGLHVPSVRQIDLELPGRGRETALLVERYDIPDAEELEAGSREVLLPLQQDAGSLLLLRRERKYTTSLERIADAIASARLSSDDLDSFFGHVAFSWIIGNGDLHAKNISILRCLKPGRLGASPREAFVKYAPPYDLVCTRLPIRDDEFALPLAGKRNNLRVRDFVAWAARWGAPRAHVRTLLDAIIGAVAEHLDPVLRSSRLPENQVERYRAVVLENLERLGR